MRDTLSAMLENQETTHSKEGDHKAEEHVRILKYALNFL